MTTTTTVFGLAPLVLFPGAGSELYCGLGAVVLGGLLVSTFFTLFLVPPLFNLMLDLRTVVMGAEKLAESDSRSSLPKPMVAEANHAAAPRNGDDHDDSDLLRGSPQTASAAPFDAESADPADHDTLLKGTDSLTFPSSERSR